ncbi:unnamed protein product [Spirodela intermedia]|uniref:RNase H type-1 domain-containing protein n=1 Tax=Spirodela intermedia TaxID=51605 RepID=A0A7I8LEV7_SPIIN|nr:unnamed protein product [Spirodela intermedia]
MKLNIDGASKGNPETLGGIIRDNSIKLIEAFSAQSEILTNMEAKCKALDDGLRLCEKLNIYNIAIETDSMTLTNMFRKNKCNQWKLQRT